MKELSEVKKISPVLKVILEFGPIALFVLVYNRGDWIISNFDLPVFLQKPIFLATIVIMATTLVSIVASWALTRTLPAMPMVTAVIVSIFGGLTLYLQDDTFIKLKPTIINTLFGVALLAGLAFGKSFLKIVFGPAFQLDEEGWMKLTMRWGVFFLFLAIVNEIVWRNFSESFWVGFKFWGMTGLSFLFVLSQTPLMMRHALEKDET